MHSQLPALQRLTIFGFGLIGASVGLAAKARWPNLQVIAIDQSAVLDSSRAQAIANIRVNADDATARQRAFAEADLTVLAAPLSVLEAVLPEALDRCRSVTDCGSTKRSVLAVAHKHAHGARFVGGHPMAGKPQGGLAQADAQLFQGRPWILCPEGAAPDALQSVEQFVGALGALPARMTAAEHDHLAALTSHVPQLLASALLVLGQQRKVPASACGPGFESATRVGGGAANIWSDIFERNGDQIALSLDELIQKLTVVAQALRGSPPDVAAGVALLAQARRVRDSG